MLDYEDINFHLDVPLIGQMIGYDGKPILWPYKDGKPIVKSDKDQWSESEEIEWLQHGQMNCWYAAICMVAQYHRQGPRQGLPLLWMANTGMMPLQDDKILMKQEGFLPVPLEEIKDLSPSVTMNLLQQHGPILAIGRYNLHHSGGHCIVLTGVEGSSICYNDPAFPRFPIEPMRFLPPTRRKKHFAMIRSLLTIYTYCSIFSNRIDIAYPLWYKDKNRY